MATTVILTTTTHGQSHSLGKQDMLCQPHLSKGYYAHAYRQISQQKPFTPRHTNKQYQNNIKELYLQ